MVFGPKVPSADWLTLYAEIIVRGPLFVFRVVEDQLKAIFVKGFVFYSIDKASKQGNLCFTWSIFLCRD